MSSSKRTASVVLGVVLVVVSAALSASVPSSAVESARHRRPPTDANRRRTPRQATIGDVRAMFGGIEDAQQQMRLIELANQDVVSAVLEYNEMVLATAMGNGSKARTCSMKLNYNVTTSLTDLFRDQVQNVLQTANSLNNALLTRGDSSAAMSDSLYQALVTALVGSDPLVYGAVIVFDPVHAGDASSSTARRAPYVFRNSTTNKLEVRRFTFGTPHDDAFHINAGAV